jgi:hypothetical protein
LMNRCATLLKKKKEGGSVALYQTDLLGFKPKFSH